MRKTRSSSSVGGGDKEKNISPNIVKAVDLARFRLVASVLLAEDTGHTAKHGDIVIVVPSPTRL